MSNKLIRDFNQFDPKTLEDLLLIMAKNMEDSLIQGGAEPGKDYTILDCYRLAQPFALSVFEKSNDMSYRAEW